jgi:hypothetical protein
MKQLIVFIISLFCAINAWTQLDSFAINKQMLPDLGVVDTNSISYLRRLVFFEPQNLDNYYSLAKRYTEYKDYDKAIIFFTAMYNKAKLDSVKNEVSFEIAKTYLLKKEYAYAEIEVFNVKEISKYFSDRKFYYLSIIDFYRSNYTSSLNYALRISYLSEQQKNEMEELYKKANRRYARPNPNLAAAFSIIVPGSGQIYTGNIKDGVNSLLLTGGALLLFRDISLKYSLYDAFIGVFPLYQRYYSGGVMNARNLAEKKIKEKKRIGIGELNTILRYDN